MLLIYFFYYVFRRLYAKTSDLALKMFFANLKENGGCRDDTRHFDFFFSFSCLFKIFVVSLHPDNPGVS